MNLLQESVGHDKYHHQVRTFPKSSQVLYIQASRPKNPQIQKCIKRLSAKKLFGHPHVKQYLLKIGPIFIMIKMIKAILPSAREGELIDESYGI